MARNNKDKVTLKKKIAFSAMSFLIFFVILLITGELFCRLKLYIQSKDVFYLTAPFKRSFTPKVNYRVEIDEFNTGEGNYYYKIKPGRFQPPPPYNYGYFTINSLGFRGREFNPYNKNNKIRIFCIGESSTFCIESADDQAWPARLSYYLDKIEANRFEVINSGFPAAASSTYSNLIRLELVKYLPDVFIIYAGANEMILDRSIVRKRVNRLSSFMHGGLYYKSMLYTLLNEKISYLLYKSPAPANIYISNPEEVFNANIEKIIKICREHNIKLIFVRQLYYSKKELFLRDDPSLQEIKNILTGSQDASWVTPDKIHMFNIINKDLGNICSKYNIRIMDFRKYFYEKLLNNERLFYDYVHLTPEGNDLLARLISEHLLGAIR